MLESIHATIVAAMGRRGTIVDSGEWRWIFWVTLVLLVASTLPYLIAWAVAPEGSHFGGLLFNPQDGNSYLAKMRQGLVGSWRFHLAFTPEAHPGVYAFLYHLLLGHLARWTSVDLILVYHAARVAGGGSMLTAIYTLASRVSDSVGERRTMFLLAALGSGLGWLAGALGVLSSDLWVPEAFPAYALLANAHFPLSMGLMVWIANCSLKTLNVEGRTWRPGLAMVGLAVTLGAIQPFGLVAVFGGAGAMLAIRAARRRKVPWRAVAWLATAGVLALPYPLYIQWAIRSNPVLSMWDAQNTTLSPPAWDWAVSYGLVLVLALLGAISSARSGSHASWLLLGWVAVTFVGMYLPLPLQRRLSLGLGVPVGLLAGNGWWRSVRPRVGLRRRALARGLTVTFCALTPLFLISMTLLAALTGEPRFYLTGDEWNALAWLRDNGHSDSVVLCAPQMGLFVPAWAGQPVVYGHPFETVDAERREVQVVAYWAGDMSSAEREGFLQENRVGYVLEGPREVQIAGCTEESESCLSQPETPGGVLVFESGGVRVYEINGR